MKKINLMVGFTLYTMPFIYAQMPQISDINDDLIAQQQQIANLKARLENKDAVDTTTPTTADTTALNQTASTEQQNTQTPIQQNKDPLTTTLIQGASSQSIEEDPIMQADPVKIRVWIEYSALEKNIASSKKIKKLLSKNNDLVSCLSDLRELVKEYIKSSRLKSTTVLNMGITINQLKNNLAFEDGNVQFFKLLLPWQEKPIDRNVFTKKILAIFELIRLDEFQKNPDQSTRGLLDLDRAQKQEQSNSFFDGLLPKLVGSFFKK